MLNMLKFVYSYTAVARCELLSTLSHLAMSAVQLWPSTG